MPLVRGGGVGHRVMDPERANRIKSEFLGLMSHELRTPLTVVMGYTNLIEDGIFGEINTVQKEALKKIAKGSEELLTMINGILQATKIAAGAIKVNMREISLKDFLDELRSNCNPRLENGPTFVWNYPPGSPLITTDTEKLKQILQNLIDNAIKFTEKGTISISARIRKREQNRWLNFEVRDTGMGIPQAEFARIFDMFCQVDSSDTRPYEGVGLGLYIVRAFTKLLGGSIDVKSKVGSGSIFTVRIPIS